MAVEFRGTARILQPRTSGTEKLSSLLQVWRLHLQHFTQHGAAAVLFSIVRVDQVEDITLQKAPESACSWASRRVKSGLRRDDPRPHC